MTLTATQLDNAGKDVAFISEVATARGTATNRLGTTTKTLLSVLADMTSLNPRGDWQAATPYATKDLYIYQDIVYLVVADHVSTTVAADLSDAKVAIYQGALNARVQLAADTTVFYFNPAQIAGYDLNGYNLTVMTMADTQREDLFNDTVGGLVTLHTGFARPEWWTGVSPSKADAALIRGGGGQVLYRPKTYAPELNGDGVVEPYTGDGVEHVGSGAPFYVDSYNGFVGGTILQGPRPYLGHRRKWRNLGVDVSQAVCDAFFGGVTQDGLTTYVPLIDIPSQTRGPNPNWESVEIDNVTVLGNGATAHGILLEGTQKARAKNCRTARSAVGLVVKGREALIDGCMGFGHSVNAFMDKSDSYASSFGNTWRNLKARSLDTFDTVAMRLQCGSETGGQHIVDGLDGSGCTVVLSLEGIPAVDGNPAKYMTDCDLRAITGDPIGIQGIQIGAQCARISIASYRFTNILDSGESYNFGNGIDIAAGADTIAIGVGSTTNTAGHGIYNRGGINVTVAAAVGYNPGPGKFAFYAEAGLMRLGAECFGSAGVAASAHGSLEGAKISWVPTTGGGLTMDGVALEATYKIVGGVLHWTMTFTPSAGHTFTAAGFSYASAAVGGEPSIFSLAKAAVDPSIPGTGVFNGLNFLFPAVGTTSDQVVAAGSYIIVGA